MSIGLIAYEALPGLVFVKVPSERGRWILTDRSAVEVDCPLCKAVTGEPCRRNWRSGPAFKHGSFVHTYRKDAARKVLGYFYGKRIKPKLRLNADDIAPIQSDEES